MSHDQDVKLSGEQHDRLFEIFVAPSGLYRWRFVDIAGRTIAASPGSFNSVGSAQRSILSSAAARKHPGRYVIRAMR